MKTVESNKINTCSGASIVELLVSLVIGSLVMTGAYTLWLNHQKQVTNLERKTELRNHMILASKRIQGSITNAGFGLPGIRAINVNLDTLTTFVNMRGDTNCTIQNNISKNSISIFVSTPSMFIVGSYLVVSDVLSGEVHKVISKNGNQLILDTAFSRDFPITSKVYPALKECFYINSSNSLIRTVNDSSKVILNEVYKFKVNMVNRVVYISITGQSKNSLPLTFNLSSITRNSI